METSDRPSTVVTTPFYPFTALPGLFDWLKENAQGWLDLGAFSCQKDFYVWASTNGLWVMPIEEGVILLTNWQDGVSVRIHPLVVDKTLFHNVQRVRQILLLLCELLQISRIEAHVLSTVGPTLRRWMRNYGLQQEGVLRQATIDWTKPEHPLISLEIWSILKMELLEV